MAKKDKGGKIKINGTKISLDDKLTKEIKKLKKEIEIDTKNSPVKESSQKLLIKMRYGG